MKTSSLASWGALACLATAPLAHAAPNPIIVVKRGGDSQDGRCEASGTSDRCNLRAALAFAQGYQGKVIIRLDADSILSLGAIEVDPATKGTELSIEAGLSSSIKGANSSSFLRLGKNASVSLNRLTVSDFTLGYSNSVVVNAGTLTLDQVSFTNNNLTCSGQGILSANALCYSPVAIDNSGTLTLRDATFTGNKSRAYAYNAAYSSASSSMGAVSSSGTLIFDGSVRFEDNGSFAEANSVPRSGAPTNATASASAGALLVSGNFDITAKGKNKCFFQGNIAEARASDPSGNISETSRAGAVLLNDVHLKAPLATSCHFERNVALSSPDVGGTYTVDSPDTPPAAVIRTDIDYLVVSRHSGKCLDVKDFNKENLALTQQWECFGGDNQRFRFVNEGNGYYSIVSRLSNRCLSAQAVSYDDGTPAVLWDCHSGPDQKVKAVDAGEGLYELHFFHSDKCLDIDGPTDANGAKAQQWQCFGSNNQKWMLRPAN